MEETYGLPVGHPMRQWTEKRKKRAAKKDFWNVRPKRPKSHPKNG